MLALAYPVVLTALVITVLEMTEVVVLVFALDADFASVKPAAEGAVVGVATIAAVALAAGRELLAVPRADLLIPAAVVLGAFGVFLFRSTLKTYRRQRAARAGAATPAPHRSSRFAGGFVIGAVESTEAVIVLLALTAAGYGPSAIVGAVAGGAALVVAAFVVGAQVRRIKAAWLKLGATSILFAFAVFWAGEALGVAWPYSDLFLVPLFAIGVVVVRLGVEVVLRRERATRSPA